MTDKTMPEDRHIEAAITLAGFPKPTADEIAGMRDENMRHGTWVFIFAHAKTLAKVEAALASIDWEASRQSGNILHFKRCVHVQLKAVLNPIEVVKGGNP